MKKTTFLAVVIFAILLAVSCKSTPSSTESEIELELGIDTQFANAYKDVLPLIYDDMQIYTVKSGDALTRIARNFYGRGNAFFFPLIMAASNDKQTVNVADPDLVEPGMELVIPDLTLNLADPEIKARIKVLLQNVAKIYNENLDTHWSLEIYNGLVSAAEKL
jgi:LysM repeat protein